MYIVTTRGKPGQIYKYIRRPQIYNLFVQPLETGRKVTSFVIANKFKFADNVHTYLVMSKSQNLSENSRNKRMVLIVFNGAL